MIRPKGEGSVDAAEEQLFSVRLGHSPPNSELFANRERIFPAFVLRWADLTNGLGSHFASFAFFFTLKRVGWEEEMSVVPSAQRSDLPVGRLSHRTFLSLGVGCDEPRLAVPNTPGKIFQIESLFSRTSYLAGRVGGEARSK